MRAAVLAPVIVAALCLSTSHAVPSVSRHRRGDGKGQASVVLRPDDMTDRSAPLLGAKIDPKIDKLTSKQGRELRDIKSPEDIRKFAHVLHGLEELFKNSDIKKKKSEANSADCICCMMSTAAAVENELSVTPPLDILVSVKVLTPPKGEKSNTPPSEILKPIGSNCADKREQEKDQEAPLPPKEAAKRFDGTYKSKDLGLRLTSSRTSPEDFETNDVDEKIRKRYDPTWESVDTRPLPNWYDEAKFGIFIHWGVYSVPSVGTEWFWWNWQGAGRPSYQEYMSQNFKPNFTYADFAPQFTAEFFNASEWATLIQSSGAKYVVLTSKHHEGFTNWPSPYSFNWNSVDVGPHKDLVGELAKAVRTETDVKFGLYYSLFEWFNPLYLKDKNASFQSRDYVVNKMTPELKSLIETYKPEIVWSDGDWEAQYTYWDSPGFLAWLYNDSPVRDSVVVNDRWGSEMACNHGGYYTCSDRYNPGTLQPHKWENCWTIDKQSWGYRRNAHIWEYCSIEELVQVLAETVACGGNLLLNVGPAHDGSIKPIFEERLLQMGAWLKINDEAIYKSNPWIHQNDTVVPGVWYTMRKFDDGSEKVYGIVLNWPASGKLVLGAPKFCSNTVVNLLGWPDALPWTASTEGPEIVFPPRQSVVSDWGWVLAFQGLCNE